MLHRVEVISRQAPCHVHPQCVVGDDAGGVSNIVGDRCKAKIQRPTIRLPHIFGHGSNNAPRLLGTVFQELVQCAGQVWRHKCRWGYKASVIPSEGAIVDEAQTWLHLIPTANTFIWIATGIAVVKADVGEGGRAVHLAVLKRGEAERGFVERSNRLRVRLNGRLERPRTGGGLPLPRLLASEGREQVLDGKHSLQGCQWRAEAFRAVKQLINYSIAEQLAGGECLDLLWRGVCLLHAKAREVFPAVDCEPDALAGYTELVPTLTDYPKESSNAAVGGRGEEAGGTQMGKRLLEVEGDREARGAAGAMLRHNGLGRGRQREYRQLT